MTRLRLQEIKEIISSDRLHYILDCRTTEDFDQAFISTSIYAGSQLSKIIRLVGIQPEAHIYLVPGRVSEGIIEGLHKLGFENVTLIEEFEHASVLSNSSLLDLMITIEPDELAMDLPFEEHARIIDLREEEIYSKGHIEGAEHIDLEELSDIGTIAEFEENQNVYLYGDSEISSFIGSLMKRQGVHNFKKVTGTFADIKSIDTIKIATVSAAPKEG
jgi:rhodanese-related sulfurtransferase